MTALSPGASPPPVLRATRLMRDVTRETLRNHTKLWFGRQLSAGPTTVSCIWVPLRSIEKLCTWALSSLTRAGVVAPGPGSESTAIPLAGAQEVARVAAAVLPAR